MVLDSATTAVTAAGLSLSCFFSAADAAAEITDAAADTVSCTSLQKRDCQAVPFRL